MNNTQLHYWICAFDKYFGIGKNNTIPWKCSEDLKWFKKCTLDKKKCDEVSMIMGYKTWESLGKKALFGRNHIILTSNEELLRKDREYFPMDEFGKTYFLEYISYNLETLNEYFKKEKEISSNCFYWIGGNQCFKTMFQLFLNKQIYLKGGYFTYFDFDFHCDIHLPSKYFQNMIVSNIIQSKQKITIRYNLIPYEINMEIIEWSYNSTDVRVFCPSFKKYETEEHQYLELINYILKHGFEKTDRTNTGTLNCFGNTMRFNLENGTIPLLTTKKVFLKGIVEELGWFLRGETDAKLLQDKNVHIWDGNSSREFLDSLGFYDRDVGDCGPVYGFQMRHFGANYKDYKTDYKGQGYDQISNIIKQIKETPTSRRIVMNLWNAFDLDQMVLPPCHVLYQFYVENDTLSCSLYQRSGDIGLGVPFNIASASILTHWLAYHTGKKANELFYILGDTHIYKNHIDILEEQIKRVPRSFPKIEFLSLTEKQRGEMKEKKIEEWEMLGMDRILLHGYYPYDSLQMKMAV